MRYHKNESLDDTRSLKFDLWVSCLHACDVYWRDWITELKHFFTRRLLFARRTNSTKNFSMLQMRRSWVEIKEIWDLFFLIIKADVVLLVKQANSVCRIADVLLPALNFLGWFDPRVTMPQNLISNTSSGIETSTFRFWRSASANYATVYRIV